MTHTLLLTTTQPLTPVELEKLWDAEQQKRAPEIIGRPQLRVDSSGPYSFELVVTAQEHAPISAEEIQHLIATSLGRNYPHCHLEWAFPPKLELLPRKGAASEPGLGSECRQQKSRPGE